MEEKQFYEKEIPAKHVSGMMMLLFLLFTLLLSLGVAILGGTLIAQRMTVLGIILLVLGIIYFIIICPILFGGLKVLKPNEALVLTFFGKYYGTLRGEGYFYVNPFVTSVNPAIKSRGSQQPQVSISTGTTGTAQVQATVGEGKKISLKAMTLTNGKQKINDLMGNPIDIGVVVIWRVVNTVQAVFNVENYMEYLSVQCDSALRNIVRLYPYDISDSGDETSLRGSSQEVAEKIKSEIQEKVAIAGLEIIEARITHLAYSTEIAAAMLQRQQASAVIDARKMIVDGAVGMVQMALEKLSENNIVTLDDERKAAMVSNLLVVLCGNKDAQPIVNSGTIY